jgi:hypothetical protein
MPITRRALLIANPGEAGQENYCKGVYVDIRNYTNLLTSAEGGAWDEGEIKRLDRPNAEEVRVWIENFSQHDYVFVMFTGHCAYSSADRDHILELKRGERIAYAELIKGAKRRSVILDCCQEVHAESLLETLGRAVTFSNAYRGRTADRANCRKRFLDGIQNTPQSIVKITSCSIGEVSSDSDTLGGRYNASLFNCVEDWVQAQKNKYAFSGGEALPIVSVHECATIKTREKSANLQNPTIEKPRTGPYFPIAVFG